MPLQPEHILKYLNKESDTKNKSELIDLLRDTIDKLCFEESMPSGRLIIANKGECNGQNTYFSWKQPPAEFMTFNLNQISQPKNYFENNYINLILTLLPFILVIIRECQGEIYKLEPFGKN